MTGTRRLLAVILVTGMAAAAALAHGLWIANRVLAPEPFAGAAVEALRGEAGQEAIAERVRAALQARTGAPVPEPVVRRAVGAVAEDPRFAAAVEAGVATAHRRLVAGETDPARAELAALAPALAEELARIDPALAALLPTGEALGAVELPGVARLAAVPRLAGLAEDQAAPVWAGLAAAALLTLALLASPRAGPTATAAGAVLIGLALVPALARALLPGMAAARAPGPPLDALAEALTVALLAGWWAPAALSAAAGLALVAAGAVRAGR